MSENKDTKDSRRKFIKRSAIAGGAAVLGLTVGLPAIGKLDPTGKMSQQLGVFSMPVVDASVTVPRQLLTHLVFQNLLIQCQILLAQESMRCYIGNYG